MGRSAIAWASMKGNLEALESLINLGADINRCDKYGMTPLLWAAWSGHTKIMIRLVKEDPECARQTNKVTFDASVNVLIFSHFNV